MIRSVLYSVGLSALLIYAVLRTESVYEQTLAQRVTRIDVYADRITYRTSQYSTPSLLGIGIKAVNDPPKMVALHDCARIDVFEDVIDEIRDQGYTDFSVQMPDNC